MFSTLIGFLKASAVGKWVAGTWAADKIGKGVKGTVKFLSFSTLVYCIWRWYKNHDINPVALHVLLGIIFVMAWIEDIKILLFIGGTGFLFLLMYDLARFFGVNLDLFVSKKSREESKSEPSKPARRRKTSVPAKPDPAKKSAAGQVSAKSTGERKTSAPAKSAPAKKSTVSKGSTKSTAEKKTPATDARKPAKKSIWKKIAHPFSMFSRKKD